MEGGGVNWWRKKNVNDEALSPLNSAEKEEEGKAQ